MTQSTESTPATDTIDATTTTDTTATPGSAGGAEGAAEPPSLQLRLLAGGTGSSESERDWMLDERTRRIGRYGVLQLRATLRQHRPAQPDTAVA